MGATAVQLYVTVLLARGSHTCTPINRFEKQVLWPWKTALENIIIFNFQPLRMGPNAAPCNRIQSVAKIESHTTRVHVFLLTKL